jgi:hypothetical protein
MKLLKSISLELYWICLYSFLTYLALKFINWYYTFNIILFYIISFWFIIYDIKTSFSNIRLYKLNYDIFLKNKTISFPILWFIIRNTFILFGIIYFLFNEFIDKFSLYEGFKIFGLLSFIGFVLVNYIRTVIFTISDIGK